MNVCSINGCKNDVFARGWCRRHYKRWHRHGHPLGGAAARGIPAVERFWPKVDKSAGCWRWLGAKTPQGYGLFRSRSQGSMTPAHRFAYEQLVGPIPEGLELDHLCRNPSCVNPAHLEPVTHAENMRRGMGGHNMAAKTHCPKGHPYAGDNLYVIAGKRHCRACRRQAQERHRAKAVITC